MAEGRLLLYLKAAACLKGVQAVDWGGGFRWI